VEDAERGWKGLTLRRFVIFEEVGLYIFLAVSLASG